MRFNLKDYQDEAVRDVLERLLDAKDDYRDKDRRVAFALSAITGAGKTVMASAVFEALFDGSEELEIDPDPSAAVLWVTDDPNLNEQTRYRIMEASDRLVASRLQIIGDKFVAEKFDPGTVYFLNRQKLTAKSFITHSDKRTVTLWETIKNTIDDPARTLFLVLDEAHRGMRPQSKAASAEDEEARSTTVLRLINGHNGIPAAPIVWGISATVERFSEAMKGAKKRSTLPNVEVDNEKVQASGLLKDTIALDLPKQAGAYETVLARAAAKATREMSELWDSYADQEAMPSAVQPLLVLQVPNKPAKSQIVDLLDAIYEAWPELPNDAIANVFGEHGDETYGKHNVPYIAPQDVEDAEHIRVLLAKDAISTGWDCPRAETLMSLRPAVDRTHITQLLGRLIRTPLARRIESDERLNAVTCFLPHFDLKTATEVADVMTGVRAEPDGPPPPPGGRVLIEPETMLWNPELPDAVRECFAALPSKAAPKAPTKPIRRMLNMAAELAIDGLVEDPNNQAHNKLYGVLDGQAAQHKDTLNENVEKILTAEIQRLTASRLSKEATESDIHLAADTRAIGGAFRLATRAFGASVANGYAKKLALDDDGSDEDDFDTNTAKATVAALAQIDAAVTAVEAAAENQVTNWFATHHAAIKALNEERRAAYDEIKQQGRTPQAIDIVVPTSRIEMTFAIEGESRTPLPTRDRHVLADADGNYPVGKLGDWELSVLDTEMAREQAVAWYRNPSSASKDAVQVPWQGDQRWRSMQPDFIFFFENASAEIVPAIVDPHGHHLQDAYAKLLGLADFADEYADRFVRVEAISKNTKGDLGADTKGELLLLDLTDSNVRKIVRTSGSAAEAYEKASKTYL